MVKKRNQKRITTTVKKKVENASMHSKIELNALNKNKINK